MALIQSYPINNNVKGSDLLLSATNVSQSGKPVYQTKSIMVSDIVAGNITPISLGVANGLSLQSNILSLGLASSTANGALSSADWVKFNAAYNDKVNSVTVTGTNTKTITLTQQDGGTVTTSWDNKEATFGFISGNIPDQTNLQNALNAKLNIAGGTITGTLRMNGGEVNDPAVVAIFSATRNRLLTPVLRLYGAGDINSTYTEVYGNMSTVNRSAVFPNADGMIALVSTSSIAPVSPSASGSVGQIIYDTNYIYVCIAANTWRRAAISAW
jgi:hypothetical protein